LNKVINFISKKNINIMEISKALETIKAVCDDAVKNGRFRTIDETAAVTEAYNTLVMVSNAVIQSNQVVEPQPISEEGQDIHVEPVQEEQPA
jgi:hypothetical protein